MNLRRLASDIFFRKGLKLELARWKLGLYPPGHYYSPVTDLKAVPQKTAIDYNQRVPGVDLKDAEQMELMQLLVNYYSPEIFPETQHATLRYYQNNEYFSYSDGIFLYLVLRYLKPQRIIEIGSGFSSAAMLDINERYFNNDIQLSFIEPFPEERLIKLVKPTDKCEIIKDFVQNVGLPFFTKLEAGDILFVDSSHVSKYRSDVNYILFEVLPVLKSGVIIHFHDIFFPFEYPVEWLSQGRSWNEAYLLKAFLQFNSSFEILLFPSYLEGQHRHWFEKNLPDCLRTHESLKLNGINVEMSTTGQSIYIKKR